LKKSETATDGARCVPPPKKNRAKESVTRIFISFLGIIITVAHVTSDLIEGGSLTGFLQHFTKPTMLFYHFMVFLSIPTFIVIGYFYQKHKNLLEKNQALLNAVPDLMLVISKDGAFLSFNNAKDVPPALPPSEFLGKNIRAVMPAEFAQKAMHYINKAKQTGETQIFEYQLPVPLPNGNMRDYEARIVSSGKDEVLALVRDITERKKFEEELLTRKKELELVLKSANAGINTVGLDGKWKTWSKFSEDYFGYRADEMIGKTTPRILHRNDAEAKEAIDTAMKKGIHDKEVILVKKDGSQCWNRLIVTKLFDENGKQIGFTGVNIDITERKLMEQQLLKAERLATIGELATIVGHDLRNPLQSIENATYYLNNELPRLSSSVPISQKTMEMLQVINDSVNYAEKIIRDLQDFSATKTPILKKTDINRLVEEILSQVEAPKNVKLCTELGHLPEIKADRDMIKRVFMNLTANGLQAMENGGALIVSTKKRKGFVEICFKDTGAGISKENLEKLFTPFFTTKAKGMGMGLSICKKFVDGHGGSIDVESEVGEGTTFTVKLPTQQGLEVKTID